MARTIGLAFRLPSTDEGLLIPSCRSVHTCGMWFALDLVWLNRRGELERLDEGVRPMRLRTCRSASAVVEVPAGSGRAVAAALGSPGASAKISAVAQDRPNRWLEAFDPRVPLYRDTYNEYLVFIVSAIGAVAGTQGPLYLVMAITGIWEWWLFVPACVVFELAVVFFVARPQMKRHERLGWALMWAAITAVMALAFFYLVAEPTL